ncbi:MAG: hypothetical protein R3B70_48900, partial [Polyangiaceae bacterium]
GRIEGRIEGRLEGRLEGRAEGRAEGAIAGKRSVLLLLLGQAGIAVSEEERARIEACADEATLDRWVGNVLGAATAKDVLS